MQLRDILPLSNIQTLNSFKRAGWNGGEHCLIDPVTNWSVPNCNHVES